MEPPQITNEQVAACAARILSEDVRVSDVRAAVEAAQSHLWATGTLLLSVAAGAEKLYPGFSEMGFREQGPLMQEMINALMAADRVQKLSPPGRKGMEVSIVPSRKSKQKK